jgi:hypothetical protein
VRPRYARTHDGALTRVGLFAPALDRSDALALVGRPLLSLTQKAQIKKLFSMKRYFIVRLCAIKLKKLRSSEILAQKKSELIKKTNNPNFFL